MKKIRIIHILLIAVLLFLLVACQGKEVTITLNANGGTITGEPTIAIAKGESAILPTPTRQGKEFLGWYLENGNKVDNSTTFSSSCTLYARWNKYNVTFLNGNGNVFKVLEENVDEVITFPSSVPMKDPELEYCYEFDKWDIDTNTIIKSDLIVSPLFTKESVTWAKIKAGVDPLKRAMFRLSYAYKDNLFDGETTTFSKDLALFAFGSASSTEEKSTISSFYSSLDFDDINLYSYDTKPTTSSIAYCIAHKVINGSDVICLTVRGENYEAEWANNFLIGQSGNHAGFYSSALTVFNGLSTYLNKYNTSSIKILITGYSRGGGVANALAYHILSNNIIAQDKLYVYTFEAPTCVEAKDGIDYPNVFNIVNSADIVTLIPPTKYGLTRCGKDIEIYSSDVDSLLSDNGSLSKLPSFSSNPGLYTTDVEYAKYCITALTSYSGAGASINTRGAYYNNYQESIHYILAIFESLSEKTRTSIKSDLTTNKALLASLATSTGLYNYLLKYIKIDGISYDNTKLSKACNDLSNLLSGPAMAILVSSANSNNFSRMFAMHRFEVTYSLLVGY